MVRKRNSNNTGANSSQRNNSGTSSTTTNTTTVPTKSTSSNTTPKYEGSKLSWSEWCYAERHGLAWVMACALIGALIGLGIGTGHLTGSHGRQSPWRDALGAKIRSSYAYDALVIRRPQIPSLLSVFKLGGGDENGGLMSYQFGSRQTQALDRSHPRAFYVLREMIMREKNGYVHPDLGLLIPAPSGAARGLGIVSRSYNHCQVGCSPGSASEERALRDSEMFSPDDNSDSYIQRRNTTDESVKGSGEPQTRLYRQEEVLLRIPLHVQMTRSVALQTLQPLISPEVRRRAPLEDLDDAALLVLLLAHERGRGRESRFQAYIATLPYQATCGYSPVLRSHAMEAIAALGSEMGLDVNGWPTELMKAYDYAERISSALARDYGSFIYIPQNARAFSLIQWSLCQVASRAIAGSSKHGSLRLVPMLDMINHDASAGSYVEMKGNERIEAGDFLDADEDDSGTFVVRSTRNGKIKPLMKGQELLANYNVPEYSSLDWFISMGFVPPERSGRWIKVDGVLPRVRREGPGVNDNHATKAKQQSRPEL